METKVTFLAELAEWPDEIDIDRRTGRKGAGRAAPFKITQQRLM